MDSKICFEMISFVVEAIRERCASFRSLTATVLEICGGEDKCTYFSSIDVADRWASAVVSLIQPLS